MLTPPYRRRLAIAAATASLTSFGLATPSRAVLFYSTSDPTYNTTAPVGSPAETAWQYVGSWNSFSGVAIAPQYFITAHHVSGSLGDTFTLNGRPYKTVPFADGSANRRMTVEIQGTTYNTDLTIWKVDGTFPTFAPLYNTGLDGAETVRANSANPAVIIGRGTQRGTTVTSPSSGDPRGWTWGTPDYTRRWGTNVITGTSNLNDGNSVGPALTFDFDANTADRPTANPAGYSGPSEATISFADSGGGLFIKNSSGKWKLAGINWAVEQYSATSGGSPISAALYDARGYYLGTNFIGNNGTDEPQTAYTSSISGNLTNIVAAINNSHAWNVDASGSWATAANWWNAAMNTGSAASAPPPSAAGRDIIFGSHITAPRTVTLPSSRTIGNLVLDGPNAYNIAGTAALTLESATPSDPSTTVSISVPSGAHTIATPLTFNKNATLNVGTAGTLSLTGTLSPAAGTTVTKSGPGSVALPTIRIPSLAIAGGSVQITPSGTSSATSRLTTLAPTGGTLDLTDNDLVLDYAGTSILPTVRNWLLTARDGGSWTGNTGLTSSAAASHPSQATALAYVEASDLLGLTGSATASWSGQTVDATSVLVKYTYYGDANLDGLVTLDDYSLLDRGAARGLTGWLNGDFNYDNAIDAADYLLIDRAYASQSGPLSPLLLAQRESQFGAAYVTALIASVPEPTTLSLLVIPPLLLRRPRKS